MSNKPPDRLSALIQHFRVEARVLPRGDEGFPDSEEGRALPNLFVTQHSPGTGCRPAPDRRAGTLLFHPRGTPTGFKIRDEVGEADDICCATVDTGGDANPFAVALPAVVTVSLSEAGPLRAVADMLLDEALSPRCGGRAVIDRLCEILVIRLLRHLIEEKSTKVGLVAGLAHPNLSRAIVAIHDRPGNVWRLEDLADIAGMSRTHFVNTFRNVVGVTPGEHLSDWRLTLARLQIVKGTPVKTAAGRVGFSSAAALSRAYTRRFGVSPSQDRARAA